MEEAHNPGGSHLGAGWVGGGTLCRVRYRHPQLQFVHHLCLLHIASQSQVQSTVSFPLLGRGQSLVFSPAYRVSCF